VLRLLVYVALGAGKTVAEPDRHRHLGDGLVARQRRRRDRHLEHRNQVPPPRLCLNTRRHDCLPSVREHDDITGLEVRRGMLEEAKVGAGCVVEAVDGNRGSSIDRLAVLADPPPR
jgi:hypothetical protein